MHRKNKIAVVAPRENPFRTVQHVCDALAKRGLTVIRCADGDSAVLSTKFVLLMGSLGSLRKTARLLEKAADKNRLVFAWVSEPLPPAELTEAVERVGVALSPASLALTWSKPILQMANLPVFALLNQIERQKGSFGSISARALRFSIENLAFLRRGLSRGWINEIFVSTEQKREFLESRGFGSLFLPSGQHSGYGRDLNLTRDIDVLFIGRIGKSLRRKSAISEVFGELRNGGVKTRIVSKGCFGQDRTCLVNRARVILHLHNYPWDTPWMRWNLAAANGALMATEPLSVPYPLIPGEHYLSAPLRELPTAILDILHDESKRSKMITECQNLINTSMHLEGSINQIVERMQRMKQQPIEATDV